MGNFDLQSGETAAVMLEPGNTTGPQFLNDFALYDGLQLEKLTGAHEVPAPSPIRVFPNPVTGHVLFIHAGGLSIRKMYLFSMAGQPVPLPGQNGYAVQVAGLPPGSYWLVLETERGRVTTSFVKTSG